MKKQILRIGAIVVGTCFIATTCLAATGKVTVNNLRIRQTPSTDAEIIELAADGDNIQVESEEGDWYKVVYNRKEGYASKQYIDVNGEVETSDNQEEEPEEKEETNTETNTENTENNNEQETNTEEQPKKESNNSKPISKDRASLKGQKVNVRVASKLYMLPTQASRSVASINAQDEVIVSYDMKNWLKVEINGKVGWVPSYYLTIDEVSTNETEETSNEVEQKTEEQPEQTEQPNQEEENNSSSDNESEQGYINASVVNVREEASTDANIVGGLEEFDIVTIVGEEGDFYKIESNKFDGYVAKRLVSLGTVSSRSLVSRGLAQPQEQEEQQEQNEEVQEPEVEETYIQGETTSNASYNASEGENIVEFAKQYLGYDYVAAGKSPSSGFDCSGFTYYVYGQFGYNLGGSSGSQAGAGEEVPESKMEPGDLLIFNDSSNSRVGHVGIYIGDGEFIHAANPSRGVVIDDVDSSYYSQRFVSARRLAE